MSERRKLPAERKAITHKFSVGGFEGYLTVGLYKDDIPGEIFCRMAKQGSTISGLMDVFATSISMSLQYGVPLEALIKRFKHTRFEPSGFTGNPEIPMADSIADYIFKWMEKKFIQTEEIIEQEQPPIEENKAEQDALQGADAPLCTNCGMTMVPNGACYKCCNCGETSGCS